MGNINIKTTLDVRPPHGCCCGKGFKTITRGATAILSINLALTDYAVDFDGDGNLDFKQLTVVFKQPNGSIGSYEYYDDDGNVDSHFEYDKLTESIDLTFSAAETAEMQEADIDSPLLWEIMIVTKDDYSIIQPQQPILVLNSIYNQMGGHSNPTPYCGESTLCSSTLVCNN